MRNLWSRVVEIYSSPMTVDEQLAVIACLICFLAYIIFFLVLYIKVGAIDPIRYPKSISASAPAPNHPAP